MSGDNIPHLVMPRLSRKFSKNNEQGDHPQFRTRICQVLLRTVASPSRKEKLPGKPKSHDGSHSADEP